MDFLFPLIILNAHSYTSSLSLSSLLCIPMLYILSFLDFFSGPNLYDRKYLGYSFTRPPLFGCDNSLALYCISFFYPAAHDPCVV